ncbi:hypothetical protein AXG93_4876s1170 [Marchantia polymorpha subsp. ruderalis]|uniref:Uncharacterized protein n=1 Tax=Marchantia polymorpha subsp. ruderalis TaxID=1480154 RepID=A0A176WF66_MARPO|nr:hypothetical protein AXG93_4876s1170 [Marchantia polymorpha subsp. ruderalis]
MLKVKSGKIEEKKETRSRVHSRACEARAEWGRTSKPGSGPPVRQAGKVGPGAKEASEDEGHAGACGADKCCPNSELPFVVARSARPKHRHDVRTQATSATAQASLEHQCSLSFDLGSEGEGEGEGEGMGGPAMENIVHVVDRQLAAAAAAGSFRRNGKGVSRAQGSDIVRISVDSCETWKV